MTNDELREKVEERQGAVSIRKELEAQIETLGDEIKGEILGRGIRRVVVGAWVPQVIVMERKTIDPKKLLSAGVTTAQIEAATVLTEVVQLRVNPRGPEDQ